MKASIRYENFPGWELIGPGLADASTGRVSPQTCLVWIAAPRLKAAGLLTTEVSPIAEPERALYALLCASHEGGDAYPAYQSLLRRLAKFIRSLK